MSRPVCFAGGCLAREYFTVANPATPLVEPVTACRAHLGDLLGNIAKSLLLDSLDLTRVDLRVTALPRADKHGNFVAEEGCTRCPCGAKYWEHDRCVSCGEPVALDV